MMKSVLAKCAAIVLVCGCIADSTNPIDAGEIVYHSELFPATWKPGYAVDGKFLHDFSYAGYRGGMPLPNLTQHEFDITDYGARVQRSDNTEAIQAAIDAASVNGGDVVIPAGTFTVAGVISVEAGNVVIRGADGAKLLFTRSENMDHKAHLTFRGNLSFANESLLRDDAQTLANVIQVTDASAYQVGDDIVIGWVITDDFVRAHNMSGVWRVFNNQWQPFFWRTVTSVDRQNNSITFDVPLRYPVKTSDSASVKSVRGYISECGLVNVAISNATSRAIAWSTNQVAAVRFEGVKDCYVDRLVSFSKNDGDHLLSGGLLVASSKRMTIANSDLRYAQHRGGGGNGYLYEIRQSAEILTRDSIAVAGRHNYIQNWGFGTSGCVWLRCESRDGRALFSETDTIGLVGLSEFHHSLAMANLFDGGIYDDGLAAENRGRYSSGAGHSGTANVFWNNGGAGVLQSKQFAHGYVIGAATTLQVDTRVDLDDGEDTTPEDFVEPVPVGQTLTPQSLYEEQRVRRLQRN